LVDFAKWCIAEEIQVLTVYAFSTENWNRHPSEVASLMALFVKYCDELRVEAIQRNINIRVLSTDEVNVSYA
jgi:undecaprenyl diphosphate synthase